MSDVLLLITGSGRSGTSTMSGTLHHLGLHVPGPYLGANDSNPKGFFESRWSVRFHNEICERAGTRIVDARPEAEALVAAAVTDADRDRLGQFLDRKAVGHAQTVVKDPRAVWTQQVWEEVAATRSIEVRYLTMLRHPAEVVGSRMTYYSGAEDAAALRRDTIVNLARWINVSLVNERRTRDRRRAFVGYPDLLAAWRPVAVRLRDELGLDYRVDPDAAQAAAVDEFIDAGLRRHATGWDDLDVPPSLLTIARGVWDALEVLAGHGGRDDQAQDRLDQLTTSYDALLADSATLVQDGRAAVVAAARAAAAEEAMAAVADRRPVSEVGGRELLRIAARRGWRRVRR